MINSLNKSAAYFVVFFLSLSVSPRIQGNRLQLAHKWHNALLKCYTITITPSSAIFLQRCCFLGGSSLSPLGITRIVLCKCRLGNALQHFLGENSQQLPSNVKRLENGSILIVAFVQNRITYLEPYF